MENFKHFVIKQIRFCDIKKSSWICNITKSISWYQKFKLILWYQKIDLWYQKNNLWYQKYWFNSKTAPHTGPTFYPFWSGSKPSDTLIVFLKDFFLKHLSQKNQQTTTKHEKLPNIQIVYNGWCYMTPIKYLLWLAETSLHWSWQILMSNSDELKTG